MKPKRPGVPPSINQDEHTYVQDGVTVGFFTDPTLCIGCKACEVACKEWNQIPADGYRWTGRSYDNTEALGASTWRHVLFVEQDRPRGRQLTSSMGCGAAPAGGDGAAGDGRASNGEDGEDEARSTDGAAPAADDPFRWLFLSDVCKHCAVAGCLEACPTGSIVRTEVGSVTVQDDVCNGCGYCVVACPFGVIDKRPERQPDGDEPPGGGGAFKCTFCYDRQATGLVPACAKTCPTESIQFGPLPELRERAARRVEALRERGYDDAQVYDPQETSVAGIHAFFLILGEPEAYGLPPAPEAPTAYLRESWASAFVTAALLLGGTLLAFAVT